MADVNIINHQQFFNSLKDFHCGKTGFVELNTSDFWLPFTNVKPPEGYQVPENAVTGEKFPNCCETHKKLLKDAEDWFDLFPQCCEPHKNLLKTTWFNKESYKGVAMKIVQQLVYTTTHIGNQLEKPDWYKDITDYIEYNVESFGQLPTGYGNPVGLHIYLPQLKNWIESKDIALPEDKRKKLSQCIDGYYHYAPPPPTGRDTRDLNILHATYLRWLKLFPFGISYFSQLKKQYSSQLPILAEPPVLNKYTGLAKAKLQSQGELIKTLHNLTLQLLQQVDTSQLLEKGVISDKNKHAIELTTANHKLKQDTLLSKYTNGELKYVKVLKAWLANEKKYFYEIAPLINKAPETPPSMVEREMEKIRAKMEKQQDEAEIERRRDFNFYIDKNYNFSPTFEDFIEELAIQKKATDLGRMLLFLREAKKAYGNARYYYMKWGARGTHIDRGPLYDKIIALINILINKLLTISTEQFQAASLMDLCEVGKPILDYTNLGKYFYNGKLSVFKTIEDEMLQRGILDSDGHWSSEYTKNDLVAFIGILRRVGIMRLKLQGISDIRSTFHIRKLFENRYQVNSLEQEIKPSRIRSNKVDYKHIFPFIPGI